MQLTATLPLAQTFVVADFRPGIGRDDLPWSYTNCGLNNLTLPVIPNVEYMIGCDGVNGATGVIDMLCSLVVPTKVIPGPKTAGGYSLSITGYPGMRFQIQAKTDLTNSTWQTLVTTNSLTNTFNFIDTNEFKYHYEFATGVLRFRGSVDQFNKNYTGDGNGRDYNLASLVLSPGTGKGGPDCQALVLGL